MEKLDIRSVIVLSEEVFMSIRNAKQMILQGLEVQTDRKLQGSLVKAEELIKRLHLLDQQANPDDYASETPNDMASENSESPSGPN